MYPDRDRDCVKEVHKDWSEGYKDFQENLVEYITNGFKKEVEFVSFTGGGWHLIYLSPYTVSSSVTMWPRVWVSKELDCLIVRNLGNTSLFLVSKYYYWTRNTDETRIYTEYKFWLEKNKRTKRKLSSAFASAFVFFQHDHPPKRIISEFPSIFPRKKKIWLSPEGYSRILVRDRTCKALAGSCSFVQFELINSFPALPPAAVRTAGG